MWIFIVEYNLNGVKQTSQNMTLQAFLLPSSSNQPSHLHQFCTLLEKGTITKEVGIKSSEKTYYCCHFIGNNTRLGICHLTKNKQLVSHSWNLNPHLHGSKVQGTLTIWKPNQDRKKGKQSRNNTLTLKMRSASIQLFNICLFAPE